MKITYNQLFVNTYADMTFSLTSEEIQKKEAEEEKKVIRVERGEIDIDKWKQQ